MARSSSVRIRPLADERDLAQCLALQRRTWGNDFRELVPPAILTISERMGGVAAGAFDRRGHLAGFVFGITGVFEGRPAHWSHMMAVAPAFRDGGIGRRLKRYQRDRLRRLGVEIVLWTFDPLIARNAHLNINHLGVRVREYRRSVYGRTARSTTDTVIGSDRFVVEWAIGPGRGRRPPPLRAADRVAPLVDLATTRLPHTPSVRIAIPRDVQVLKIRKPREAKAWRRITRRAFEHYLTRGYHIVRFVPPVRGLSGVYVLRRDDA